MKYRQVKLIILLISFSIAVIFLSPLHVDAYGTDPSWSTSSTYYSIDPSISNALGVVNAQNEINTAARTWNNSTVFDFREGYWNGYGNTISSAYFGIGFPCNGVDPGTVAYVCYVQDTTYIYQKQIFFNATRSTVVWNTSNINNDTSRPKQKDVQALAAHEFGHWFELEHSSASPSTMNLNVSPSRSIYEDDKQGVTQLYGPYTGFDSGRATGLQNFWSYAKNVNPWPGASTPELGVVGSEFGVNPLYSSGMLRIAGTATQTGNAYIYFKLFSKDKNVDIYSGTSGGVTIPSGARLKWCQYNYTNTRMSVTANFSDGTSIGNYNVVDQNGVSIHPRSRGVYSTGAWWCFNADLSPVVGKTVIHWYVAYDTLYQNESGPFRAYFDSIKLVWPGGKQ